MSGRTLAAAIWRLSLLVCVSVEVARKSSASPCASAAPRSSSSVSNCSLSVGGFFFSAAGAAFASASADFFVAGAGALLPESPQPAITAATTATMVHRAMTTSEGTMSGFPPGPRLYTSSGAKLVR